MRSVVAALLALAPLVLAVPTHAAPVAVSPVIAIQVGGLLPLTVGGFGTIDITGSTITVPAGLVTLPGTLVLPVTSTTAIDTVSLSGFSNLGGVFSPGGAGAQAPGEICPPLGPAAGQACVLGGGLGGVMALTGTLNVNVIPGFVVIPVALNAARIGQGGSTNVPFPIDAAAWTTGVGLVNTGTGVFQETGSPGGFALSLSLVTPTFADMLGMTVPIFTSFAIETPGLPEPSGIVLLVVGGAGIALLARGGSR